jgi:hypothetical protein
MKLQELINEADLVMTLPQIKAFFLGALHAEKPLPFDSAILEVLEDKNPELEAELRTYFDELKAKRAQETKTIFPKAKTDQEFMSIAREQLDFFLMGMSLAGTHGEACSDTDVGELIDELEDTVLEIDEYLSVENPEQEDTDDIKTFFIETWEDFIKSKKF